jgi:hypothetical protein
MDGSSRPRAPQPAPPDRAFSFTDWQTNNPTAPPPGDKIDAELDRTNQAVEDVIEWVSTSLNSDGSLVEPPGTDPPPPTGAVAEAEEWAVVSQAWAEHMPDTIPPNILAEMAITGEHWSARWWAKQAADQVQNPDAPDDGFTYGRMAHHWKQVLPLTGGTIDGTLTVLGTPSDGAMHVRSAAEWPGTVYHIDNDTGGAFLRSNREGLARWLVYLGDDAPETGGNQGTNFKISRADDAGNEIDFPIQIDRATGQVLINGVAGGSGGSGLTPQQIDALTYGVKADYVELSGGVQWSGNVVTLFAHSFVAADIGKTLLMPAGGPANAPKLTTITGVALGAATVDPPADIDFSGLTNIIGGPNGTPWNIDVAAPGAGGSFIGDVLTLVAPAIRPGTVQVIQTTVLSATVINPGSNGPVGAVLLRGTTGYGRRVVLSGTVDATGTLLPALTLDPATGADPGAYWFDVEDPANEPLRADPQKITFPARWDTSNPAVTLDSGQVSSLVMPSIHVGAVIFCVDDNNQVAFPPHTTVVSVDTPSLTITVSNTATVTNGSSGPQNVDFSDNKHEIAFTATFGNNALIIQATGPLPAGVAVGQVIYGPGLSGGGDPTNPAAGTTIELITYPNIFISRPTTHAASTAVTVHAVPYLTGAVVQLNLVPAVLAFKDRGAYTGAPGTSGVPFATTRNGIPTDITLLIDNPTRNVPVAISMGTDNTAQINAWLAAARTMMNANAGGVEATLRPGRYLTLGTVNARNLNQNGSTLRVSGVRIVSAAQGLRAWDASGAASYRMVGDFVLTGNQLFPPDIGMVFAWSDTQLRCNGCSLRDISATGWFSFASVYIANAEGFHVINMQSGNAMPWPTPIDPTNPLWHPTFGKVIDGDNSYNKLDGPPHNTHGSFVGFLEDNGASNCNGGAVPFSVVGCGGYTNRAGYAASWSTPAIFFSKSGPSDLDIHCEVETLTDAIFLWDRNNGVASFSGSTFKDHACYATNSVFSYDHLAKFGVHIAAFNATNCRVAVGPQHNNMQIFDDHLGFPGSLAWHGDISVGGVLKTYAPHWVRNFPDDREGILYLGDDKTNFYGDIVNTSTLIAGSAIVQGNATVSGQVFAGDGLVLGDVGFPQGTLKFDGTNVTSTKPISLPDGSVAVTQAPGDNDTSVATTAFVQAAASAAVSGAAVINTQTIAAITANTITVPAGTNHILVQDSINAVNTLTVGSGTLADGYDMWLHFPNGGSFAGVPVSAHGNLTLKVFAGGWSILAKFG